MTTTVTPEHPGPRTATERRLATSDLWASRLALGTMTFGVEADARAAEEMLEQFVEAGGNLIDTADTYGDGASEEIIGRWLRRSGRRDDVIVATKGRFPVAGQPGAGLSADYLHRALDASLHRLDVENIDLYQAHGPDLTTPLDELARFFEDAVTTGKVRHIGVSNLPGWQLAKLATLLEHGPAPLVSHQPQYNLLVREPEWEVLPAAHDAGIPAIVWGPLAAGWLTGKYERDRTPPSHSRLGDDPSRGIEAWHRRGTEHTWWLIDMLRLVADDAGTTPLIAALSWVADRPGVASAIVGARSSTQLTQSLRAMEYHLPTEAADVLTQLSEPPTPDYPYQFISDCVALMS